MQPANLGDYLVASTTLPPWHAVDQSPAWQKYLRDEPRLKPFVDQLPAGRPTPKLTAWDQITTILAAARENTHTLEEQLRARHGHSGAPIPLPRLPAHKSQEATADPAAVGAHCDIL